MPGSKLLTQVGVVNRAANVAEGVAMDFLKYRIQLGTLVEDVLPKAAKRGSYDGRGLDVWEKTYENHAKETANCKLWLIRRLEELLDEIMKLGTMLQAYDPAKLKKSNAALPPERVAERVKKFKLAMGVYTETRDLAKEIQKSAIT